MIYYAIGFSTLLLGYEVIHMVNQVLDVQVVRSKLESLLSSNSIPYAYSTHSKFHKFCEKNLFPES